MIENSTYNDNSNSDNSNNDIIDTSSTYVPHSYGTEKRLHPLTILYRAIASAPGVLIPFYFVYTQGSIEDWLYILIGVIVGIFLLPGILLNYVYFTYYITPDEVVIRSGILSRKQRNIPIARVQNVESSQNFLQRLLGLVKIRIETAGGGETEGLLEFVSKKEAEMINQIIDSYKARLEEAAANPMEGGPSRHSADINFIESNKTNRTSQKDSLIFSMSLWDVTLYGMLRLRPTILILFAWLFSMSQQFGFYDFDDLPTDDIEGYIQSIDIATLIAYLIVGVIAFLIASWLIDIALTINKYYGFKLSKESGKLHTEFGLLGKKKGTIPLEKLQMTVIFTNAIRRKLGFYGLKLETAGFAAQQGKVSEVAVPFTKFERLLRIAKDVTKIEYPDELINVSRKTIRRAMVRYVLAFIFPLAGLYFVTSWFWLLLVLVPLFYYGAVLRYQFRGYYITGDTVIIKQGFWFQRIIIIPIAKIQTLNIRQTFFQRRLGLASLIVDTAAGSTIYDAKIDDIDQNDAEEIMQRLNDNFSKIYAAKSELRIED